MNCQIGSMARLVILCICFIDHVYFSSLLYAQDYGPPLPGTKPLTMSGDIASELVAGVDRFLLKQIEESRPGRQKYWNRDFSSMQAYQASIEPNRKTLAPILGVRDRSPEREATALYDGVSYLMTANSGERFTVRNLRWPAFGDVTGEGLESVTQKGRPTETLIVIPDADQTPEQLFGLAPGVPTESQVARRLAQNGYTV